MPAYNHEKYVEQAILSVINQTYKNIQLIVVDDGSSDNTPNIIQRLANLYEFTYKDKSISDSMIQKCMKTNCYLGLFKNLEDAFNSIYLERKS